MPSTTLLIIDICVAMTLIAILHDTLKRRKTGTSLVEAVERFFASFSSAAKFAAEGGLCGPASFFIANAGPAGGPMGRRLKRRKFAPLGCVDYKRARALLCPVSAGRKACYSSDSPH